MVWAPTKPSVSDKRPVPQFANMYKQRSALRAFSARLFLSFSSCLVFFSSLFAFFFFVVVDVAVLNGVCIGIAVGVEVRFRRGKRPYFRWSRAVFLTSWPHPHSRHHIILVNAVKQVIVAFGEFHRSYSVLPPYRLSRS